MHADRSAPLLVLLLAATSAAQALIHTNLEPSGLGSTISQNPNLAPAIAALQDLDGDGTRDFVVLGRAPSSSGGLALALSFRSGADGSTISQIPDLWPSNEVTGTVENAGDVDGDAVDDVLVSHGFVQAGGAGPVSSVGDVRLYSSATGALIHQWVSMRPATGIPGPAGFGSVLAGIEDVDGDGVRDLVISDPTLRVVAIYSGATGVHLRNLLSPLFASDGFGRAVEPVGDWDGDGGPDIAVSAPVSTIIGQPAHVYVFSAQTGQILTSFTSTFSPAPFSSSFANTLAAVGDVNADGLDDLALLQGGAPVTPDPDRVLFLAGGSGTVLWNGGFPIPGNGVSPVFSTSPTVLDTMGDLDGDGLPELVLAGPDHPLHVLAGSGAGVVAGPTAIPDPFPPGTITPYGSFLRLRPFTDIDGDGVRDMLMTHVLGSDAVVAAFSPVTPESASVTLLTTQLASGVQLPLTSSPPLLGGAFTLNLAAAPPTTPGYLIIAPAPEVVLAISPNLVLYPDLSSIADWLLLPIATDPAGAWSLSPQLPSSLMLAGLEFVLQAWLPASPQSLTGASASNGLRLVLGL